MAILTGNGEIKSLKKFSKVCIHTFRIFFKIGVQVFNISRVRTGYKREIFHGIEKILLFFPGINIRGSNFIANIVSFLKINLYGKRTGHILGNPFIQESLPLVPASKFSVRCEFKN
jgi:hypothetical protein